MSLIPSDRNLKQVPPLFCSSSLRYLPDATSKESASLAQGFQLAAYGTGTEGLLSDERGQIEFGARKPELLVGCAILRHLASAYVLLRQNRINSLLLCPEDRDCNFIQLALRLMRQLCGKHRVLSPVVGTAQGDLRSL